MKRGWEALDRTQRIRGAVLLSILFLGFGGLAARLIQINVEHAPRLLALARQQQEASAVIPARRGMIVDRRGRVAASSELIPDVFIDPALSKDLPQLAGALAARLNIAPHEILAKVSANPKSRYVVVATRVDEVTAQAVREMKEPAVGLTKSFVRHYPLGESLAHVIGYTGRDGHGQEGMELVFDKHLAGSDGHRATIRDARRRALRRVEGGIRYPTDGGHVVLTVDAEIQRIAEAALADAVAEFDAEGGIVMVMQPRTGEVLAMGGLPTFDPNQFRDDSSEARRNRAVTDPVEPGSTIKVFIATGALEKGFVRPGEMFDCEMGKYYQGSRLIKDEHPYGMMDIAGIIKKSSNIGMTKLAERIDKKSLHDIVRQFRFGTPTGIECPGENAGIVTPMSRWSHMTSTSVSFGYEVGMTPLQLCTAFCAIVNHGEMMKPRVVRQLLGPDGTEVEARDAPVSLGMVAKADIAKYVADEILVGVVSEGTGRGAKLEHYNVLGKTGTAKLTYQDRKGYEPGAYLSTFMGAAPASDPQVAVMVMVRRPNAAKGYYGGTVSAPAVGKILGEVLAYLQIPPEKNAVAMGN